MSSRPARATEEGPVKNKKQQHQQKPRQAMIMFVLSCIYEVYLPGVICIILFNLPNMFTVSFLFSFNSEENISERLSHLPNTTQQESGKSNVGAGSCQTVI